MTTKEEGWMENKMKDGWKGRLRRKKDEGWKMDEKEGWRKDAGWMKKGCSMDGSCCVVGCPLIQPQVSTLIALKIKHSSINQSFQNMQEYIHTVYTYTIHTFPIQKQFKLVFNLIN